jgi:predicted nucleic acid-binding Zn ribbon protein
MIIFGWNFQTIKEFGVVFKQFCNHCKNEEYWILTRRITWFTLFFIPLIPYSIKYFLSCPVCKYGITLDEKQIHEIKPIAEINQLLINKEITQEEYQSKILKLSNGSTESTREEIMDNKTINTESDNQRYCSNCGNKIEKKVKFCSACGTKTNLK